MGNKDMIQKEFWWKNPKYILPNDSNEIVLIVVDCSWRNLRFVDAFQLATFDKKEGWCIEGFKHIPSENMQVKYWARIPEVN